MDTQIRLKEINTPPLPPSPAKPAVENVENSPKLLPCPFCGGEAAMRHLFDDWWVKCTGCGSIATASFSGEGEAAAAWNRRA